MQNGSYDFLYNDTQKVIITQIINALINGRMDMLVCKIKTSPFNMIYILVVPKLATTADTTEA